MKGKRYKMKTRLLITLLIVAQFITACVAQSSSASQSGELGNISPIPTLTEQIVSDTSSTEQTLPTQTLTPQPFTSVETQPSTEKAIEVATETPTPVGEATGAATETLPSETMVSFSQDILPILNRSCTRCHGGTRKEKGLDLRNYEAIMAGSTNGPVVIPGDPDNSPLVYLVVQGKMPKRGAKLTPEEVQIFIDWVNQGALNN
jgi:hypothetical protein